MISVVLVFWSELRSSKFWLQILTTELKWFLARIYRLLVKIWWLSMRITMIWAVLVKYVQTLTEFIDLLNWIKLVLTGFWTVIRIYWSLQELHYFLPKMTISLEVFTIFPQHKNGNIANLVLAMPFKITKTNEVCDLKR